VLALLARLLPPEDFGIATVATVSGNLIAYGAQMGLGAALVQADHSSEEAVGALFLTTLAAAAASAGIFAAAAWTSETWYDGVISARGAAVYAAGVFALVLATVPEGLVQRRGRFRELALAEGTAYFAGSLLTAAALGYLLGDYRAILIGSSVSHILRCAFMLRLTRHEGWNAKPSWSGLTSIFRFGGWFSLNRVLNYASKEADNLIIGARVGAEAVGVYSRAYILASMPANYLGSAIERVFFPLLSREFHSDEKPHVTTLKAMELVLSVGLPLSVILFTFASELVTTLFGPGWDASVQPFAILSCAVGWRLAYKFSDSYAKATGGVRDRAIRELVVLLFLLIGTSLAAGLGINSIAIVVALSVMFNFLLAGLQAVNHADESPWVLVRLHKRPFLCLFSCMPITIGIRAFLPMEPILSALAGITLATLLSLVLIGIVMTTVGPDNIWKEGAIS